MYSIYFEGNEIELPTYTAEIAGKIEKIETSNSDIITDLKSRYEFISKLIGATKLKELIGTFNQADPNNINMLYLMITSEYNRPIEEFATQKASEKLSTPEATKMLKAVDAVGKMEKFK